MGLTKLGRYIEQIDIRNEDNKLGEKAVRGLSTQKQIIETKADLRGVNLSNYKVFPPGTFAFVPDTSRRGDKISLAYNRDDNDYLVSSISVVFKVSEPDELNSQYLFMFFNRPEFDRYARFNSWGSTREPFSWDDMCDVDIELPPLPIQEKYAAIYNSMLKNQRSYERGLDDLKFVCDAFIEKLRRDMKTIPIGKYLTHKNDRNTNKNISCVMGLSTKKEFREAQSRVNRDELGNYKIVKPREFVFVPTTDTWKVLAFAYNSYDYDVVVSPIYEVFSVDQDTILSEYLAMWLSRQEFDRYARYHSWGSARENFSFNDMCEVRLPIPDIEIQQAICNLYRAYRIRQDINNLLSTKVKNICPILIKGSLEEGAV